MWISKLLQKRQLCKGFERMTDGARVWSRLKDGGISER